MKLYTHIHTYSVRFWPDRSDEAVSMTTGKYNSSFTESLPRIMAWFI